MMTAPSIGGYTMMEFIGEINRIGENVQKKTRAGVSGVAYRRIGKQPVPTTISTIADFTSESGANTAITNYFACKGSLKTVVDKQGRSHTNIMVLDVRIMRKIMVITPVGGVSGGAYLVYAEWDLEYTGTS